MKKSLMNFDLNDEYLDVFEDGVGTHQKFEERDISDETPVYYSLPQITKCHSLFVRGIWC